MAVRTMFIAGWTSAVILFVFAQTTGTVVKVDVVAPVVTATAGTVTCALTRTSPRLPGYFLVSCVVGTTRVKSDESYVTPGASATIGHHTNGADSITWSVKRPTATGPFSWEMVANGKSASGTL